VAVYIEAKHYCVISRGVEDINSETITTDLRGVFKSNPGTRSEFLASCRS
jgi:GTP cyclohydrolase I